MKKVNSLILSISIALGAVGVEQVEAKDYVFANTTHTLFKCDVSQSNSCKEFYDFPTQNKYGMGPGGTELSISTNIKSILYANNSLYVTTYNTIKGGIFSNIEDLFPIYKINPDNAKSAKFKSEIGLVEELLYGNNSIYEMTHNTIYKCDKDKPNVCTKLYQPNSNIKSMRYINNSIYATLKNDTIVKCDKDKANSCITLGKINNTIQNTTFVSDLP